MPVCVNISGSNESGDVVEPNRAFNADPPVPRFVSESVTIDDRPASTQNTASFNTSSPDATIPRVLGTEIAHQQERVGSRLDQRRRRILGSQLQARRRVDRRARRRHRHLTGTQLGKIDTGAV